MPRTTRELLLRHADECLNDFARAKVHLDALVETYQELHPKEAEYVKMILAALAQAAVWLTEFRNKWM
jgi:hypothetical protein